MQESKQVGRCHLYETSHCRGWEKARDREQDERSRDAARKEGALQCEKERHRWANVRPSTTPRPIAASKLAAPSETTRGQPASRALRHLRRAARASAQLCPQAGQ